jgi:GTPase
MQSLTRSHSPQVAIIGRPNVGKSTLFNVLTDSRRAMVKNEPGVTRDLIQEDAHVWGKDYLLIDTGGLTEASDLFSQLIRSQVTEFLKTVDLLLVVADGRAGLIPEDREVVRLAKETGLPFLLIVNKVDSLVGEDMALAEFYEFGVDVVAAAFEQRRGLSEVLEWLNKHLPENTQEDINNGPAIAILGKPNVGKSSLCNALVGAPRVLVSNIAGTTVDAVDIPLSRDGKDYLLIDTAGLRRTRKRKDGVEAISAIKSEQSIKRADVVLLVVDGTLGPSDQDARIVQEVQEAHKAVILVVNKSDLGKEQIAEFRKTLRAQIEQEFHFVADIPVCFISALTGAGLDKLFETIEDLWQKLKVRIPTGELNNFFMETIRKAPSPVSGTKNVKFYYLTQTRQTPPSFIAFANHPDGVDNAYRRFLIKHMKERWDLHGVPIRIFVMKSRGRSE